MLRIACLFLLFIISYIPSRCQTRDELEKQRQQLHKEIEQTENLLKTNRKETKENLLQLRLINTKVNLQDRVIDNLTKDLRILNNNMYQIQKDIGHYNRLLDTLKQEYAKSMVYAYKNRSNYDFLNFIFSASNFNDAIKRVAYLKSYREYREMQGENILRTQNLRKKKREELAQNKVDKNSTLQIQNKEMLTLEQQKQEKDRIVNELKRQGKDLNKELATKQKQMKKVSNAITAAIKRAQDEARKAAIAKAAAEERKRKEAELAAKEAASKSTPATASTTPATPPVAVKPKAEVKRPASVLLNTENIELNSKFEANRGSLPWPVDRGVVIMHYGENILPSGTKFESPSVTIAADIGSPVRAVFNGVVSAVQTVENMQVIVIQHGRYFSSYSNLTGVTVHRGQDITTGQVLGKVAANIDGIGAMDFLMSSETSELDPERWLRSR